jgi:hypothetical protein
MVTVNLPDEFTIPLGRKGVYGSRVIHTADYPENILVHWFMYGTRQSTNDAMADKKDDDGIKLSDTDIVAKADKRLATYKLGELRTQRESSEPADPVEREAWRMAREKIEKQLTAENMWPAKGRDKFDRAVATRCEYLGRKMTTEEYIVAWLEKNPKVRTQAGKNVAAAAKLMADAGEMV